jgi:hypothetical protein
LGVTVRAMGTKRTARMKGPGRPLGFGKWAPRGFKPGGGGEGGGGPPGKIQQIPNQIFALGLVSGMHDIAGKYANTAGCGPLTVSFRRFRDGRLVQDLASKRITLSAASLAARPMSAHNHTPSHAPRVWRSQIPTLRVASRPTPARGQLNFARWANARSPYSRWG